MNEGLIFADGRMLTAVEAAAYIKELKAENEKLKEELEEEINEHEDLKKSYLELHEAYEEQVEAILGY